MKTGFNYCLARSRNGVYFFVMLWQLLNLLFLPNLHKILSLMPVYQRQVPLREAESETGGIWGDFGRGPG